MAVRKISVKRTARVYGNKVTIRTTVSANGSTRSTSKTIWLK